MKRFPFYNEEYEADTSALKSWESKKRSQHAEIARWFDGYRRDKVKFDQYARRGMKVYNVVQTAKPTDEVSRIFLGLTRSVIDRGHEQLMEGAPGFAFAPRGPSDSKKVLIWAKMIENQLSDCNYMAAQNIGFRDLFTLGSVVFEQFCDYPTRTVLVPNKDSDTGYDSVIVRDFSRPQIGIRHVNPLDAWRNPNINNPTEVPSCFKRSIYSWNQFAQDFGNSKKYKNCFKIQKGSHVAVFEYQDELTGENVKYAYGFGNEQDGYMDTAPELSVLEFAVPILYRPMKIHETKENGAVVRSDGLNLLGKCNIRWGTYFDLYDNNYRGTHAVYGMGLPQRIEAEDMTMQTVFNINLDNFRWSQAVALNYEGNNADSYLDLDANRLYGGEVIDGKITPQPLGIARIGDYQAMKQDIEESLVPAAGINHRAMLGDMGKTAFEFGQRLKLASRSAEQLASRLEDELFKPLGLLVLAGSLSDLTVKEYEDMTEEQVNIAKEKIKNGEALTTDYKDLEGDAPKAKVRKYVRIPGYRSEENFTESKKRSLKYSASDTLKLSPAKKDETAYVPLEEEYVVPASYIESGILPDCTVDSKRMLGDRKIRDAKNMESLSAYLSQLSLSGLVDPKSIEWKNFIKEYAEIAGVSDDKIFVQKSGSEEKDLLNDILQKSIENETSSPADNAQLPQTISSSGAVPRTPQPQSEGQADPQSLLERAAVGAL